MVTPELHMAAAALVFHEADCLDRWRWQDWLDRYTDDCLFWCPSLGRHPDAGTDRAGGVKLPVGSHIQSLYRQAIDTGYGRHDLLAWYELIEQGVFDG